MGMRDWLIIIVIVGIILILLDGYRRKRKDSIRVKIDKNIPPHDAESEAAVELPNGGARIIPRDDDFDDESEHDDQIVPVLMDAVAVDKDLTKKDFSDNNEEFVENRVRDREDDREQNREQNREENREEDNDWDSEAAIEEDISDEDELDDQLKDRLDDNNEDERAEDFSEDYDESNIGDYAEDKDTEEEFLEEETLADTDSDNSDYDGEVYGDGDDELNDELNKELDNDEELSSVRISKRDKRDKRDKREDQLLASKANTSRENKGRIEPTLGGMDGFSEEDLEDKPVRVNSTATKSPAENPDAATIVQAELFSESPEDFIQTDDEHDENDDEPLEAEEVIVINVMAKQGELFAGSDLLPILMQHDMRLGRMSIFHKHTDSSDNGPVVYSMANMVKPGTFDVTQMEEFSTPGVSFFLQLPNAFGNMKSFEQMLNAADSIKESLNGDLKDEHRSVITRQTIEHCRQRIQDFELAQLSKK
ncbi:cell division protein ZipA [Gammaproteobacteria bacterium]|nr:cell division protein ZipA [Gammaproteobacteria bacterium]